MASHNASVYISGQDDLFSPLRVAERIMLCTAEVVPPTIRKAWAAPKGLRRQLLRFPDHRNRMAEIVQWLHGIHIQSDAALPQKPGQLRISSSSLMARYVKRNHPHLIKTFQSLIDRSSFLR